VGFQIYGNSAEQIISAAIILESYNPDFIDINLGCSVRRIANHGAGARLLETPAVIAQIFTSLVDRLRIPVTAKIRLGRDRDHLNYIEVVKILNDFGAAAIAVHARARLDSWQVESDWQAIAEIKKHSHVPIIGNGDIKVPEDIDRMKKETGCDAVMIGRAALGNPWILSRIKKDELSRLEIIQTIQSHLNGVIAFYGFDTGILLFRKHLKAYLTAYQFHNLDLNPIIHSNDPINAIHEQITNL
jgi:nifR3 family TIM-barrel protein